MMKKLVITVVVAFSSLSMSSRDARAVDFVRLTCDSIPATGQTQYDARISCRADIKSRRGTAQWFNAYRQECSAFCAGLGQSSAASPDGSTCTSGENRPQSAEGRVDYSPTGCWTNRLINSDSCSPGGNSRSVSAGEFCYSSGQVRDGDVTDRTVGCFCISGDTSTPIIEVGIHSKGAATVVGVSGSPYGWTRIDRNLVNDKPGRIFDVLGTIPFEGAASLQMQVTVRGQCGTKAVIDGAIAHSSGFVTKSGDYTIQLPACPGPTSAPVTSSPGQCSDGIDNDQDGRTDALQQLSVTNGQYFSVGELANRPGVYDPRIVQAVVLDNIRRKKFAFTAPLDNGAHLTRFISDLALPVNDERVSSDKTMLTRVCNILGYRTYVSSTCRDWERSHKYPNGKCSFDSPVNNGMWTFRDGSLGFQNGTFVRDGATYHTWLSSITCRDALAACSDGWDNDGDGLVDMADSGCSSAQDNSEVPHDPRCDGPAGTTEFEQCRNRIDDDNDGKIDAADPGCWKTPGTPASYDPNLNNEAAGTSLQCQNGIDDDSDGLIDLQDPGCSSPTDDRENDGTSQCQDGVDNDQDGATDFPNDFSCTSRQDNDELNQRSQCQDGVDNDQDGATDFPNDFSCVSRQDNDETNGRAQCQDGVDNDQDGATDFPNDFSCASRQDNDELNQRSQCQDGVDNDQDSLTDLADPGCSNRQDNIEGDGTTQCQDTLDNDKDGLVDLQDPGCSSRTDNSESDGTSECQDTIDNDNDGLVDSADPGCSTPTDPTEGDEAARFTVGVECVVPNVDGSKTVYFSYNNLTGGNTCFNTSRSAGTVNEFVTSTGQVLPGPSCFQAGLGRGSVVVPLVSESLTWRVRARQSAASQATASTFSATCAPVAPVAECRGFKGGKLRVKFGYDNRNAFRQELPIGELNKFTPGDPDRGQPRSFFPGLNKSVFEVTVEESESSLTWNINGVDTAIDNTLAVCDGECIDTPTGTITGQLDKVASDLSSIMNRAAQVLGSSRAGRTEAASRRDRRDAARARKKAALYEQTAKSITIQIPAVVKTCPEAPAFCETVDRGPAIEALRTLYAQQYNSIRRVVSRAYFRNTGTTGRGDALKRRAKALRDQGLAQLARLPRVSVVCD